VDLCEEILVLLVKIEEDLEQVLEAFQSEGSLNLLDVKLEERVLEVGESPKGDEFVSPLLSLLIPARFLLFDLLVLEQLVNDSEAVEQLVDVSGIEDLIPVCFLILLSNIQIFELLLDLRVGRQLHEEIPGKLNEI